MTEHRTLDRQIAERMGWTVRHSKQSDTYAITNADNYLFVANALWQMPMYSHNTFETMMKLGERNTEAEAWNDCPLFSTDLNAAMTLLDNVSWELKKLGPALYTCDIWEAGYLRGHENGYTPALAICRAWLAYTVPQPQPPAAGDVSG